MITPQVLGGRYRLDALLGSGGVADVHRALDTVTCRQVAIKVFRPGAELLDAEDRRRHEVEVLASLHHPGVVRLLDADVRAGSGRAAYIVVELVDGPNLRARLAQGPLGATAVAALGARLADTLDHVHGRGVVHRDVKPANVLLPVGADPEQGAKLADFGIARLVDRTRTTAEGLTVGTAAYLSPEQVTSGPIGPASDVYSLGLVLIEALTGAAVYRGHGVETALRRLHRQPELPAGLDPLLAETLTAMTALNPAHRPDAHEAARALALAAEPTLVGVIMALDSARRGRPPARHRMTRTRDSAILGRWRSSSSRSPRTRSTTSS